MRRLLLVCYGNICRSPFMESYLRERLGSDSWDLRSAGFHGRSGRKTPDEFAEVAAAGGVALGGHRSRVLETSDIDWADAIVIMDRDNWRRVRSFGAGATRKIIWLGAMLDDGTVEVADPYGRSEEEMAGLVERMKKAGDSLVDKLLRQHGKK